MFQAVVLSRLRTTRSGEDPSEAQVRLERAARVQRREATVHFVTGRTDARLSARRACSTVTTWRQPEFSPDWMFNETGNGDFCRARALYSHRGVNGKVNLVYYDGHAKAKRWDQTMWPLTQTELFNTPPTSDTATDITTDWGWTITRSWGSAVSTRRTMASRSA